MDTRRQMRWTVVLLPSDPRPRRPATWTLADPEVRHVRATREHRSNRRPVRRHALVT